MDFSLSEAAVMRRQMLRMVAEQMMRPISRQFDEEEHTVFPELRRVMGRKQLAELGRALQAAKATAPTKPHPHLPDEPPLLPLVGVAAGMVDLARSAGESAFKRIRC